MGMARREPHVIGKWTPLLFNNFIYVNVLSYVAILSNAFLHLWILKEDETN